VSDNKRSTLCGRRRPSPGDPRHAGTTAVRSRHRPRGVCPPSERPPPS